jgi:hypothetical protein
MTHGIAVDILPFLHHARHGARCVGGAGVSFRVQSDSLLVSFWAPGIRLLLRYDIRSTLPISDRHNWEVVVGGSALVKALETIQGTTDGTSTPDLCLSVRFDDLGRVLDIHHGGITASMLVLEGVLVPHLDHELIGILGAPAMPSTASYSDQTYELLGSLLGSDQEVDFLAPLQGIRHDTVGLPDRPSEDEQQRLLQQWRDRLARTPGYYLDEHIALVVDPLSHES